MLKDFVKYVDVAGLAVVKVSAGRLLIEDGWSYVIIPVGEAVKLFVAEELSFQADTLLPVRMTFVAFCPSSHTLSPEIDMGSNELGIGAAVTTVEEGLDPTALIAFRYIVYTVPFVRPLTVSGVVVCTGLKGVNITPSVE